MATILGNGFNIDWNARPTKDYALMAKTGAKCVRFPVQLSIKGDTLGFNRPVEDAVTQARYARSHGMRLIVALFIDPMLPADSPLWTSKALQASLVDAWRQLSKLLAPFRNVTCDLLNEPIAPNDTVWPALALRLVDAIREIDPPRKVIFQVAPGAVPDAFANAKPLPRKNIIYGVHFYERHAYTHQGIEGRPAPVAFEPGQMSFYMSAAIKFQQAHKVTMHVGEFSVARWAPNREQWLTEALALFNKLGWEWSYLAWQCWQGWDAEMDADQSKEVRNADSSAMKMLKAAM